MSDEGLQLELGGYPESRDQAPVPALEWPERLSQTLLAHHDRCPRSAYLYVKHAGRVKSHEMDRGTLAHACFERLMVDLIQNGEESMVGQRAGSDTVSTAHAVENLSFQTGALVEEVLREFGDRLHVPAHEADVARVCTYHAALGLDVGPEDVLGIERKFVLDLDCGIEVSVKADLIHSPETGRVIVDDYKTSLWVPPADEWSAFQVKTALVAVLYGAPVERVPCPRCDATGVEAGPITLRRGESFTLEHTIVLNEDGSVDSAEMPTTRPCSMCGGRCSIEVRGDRIGSGWSRFTGRELYPRKDLRRDGLLHRNERSWTKIEMDEFRADLERAGERLLERMAEPEAVWPARKGSWCSICPAERECPIPAEERDHEGAVLGYDHAALLWEWALAMKERAAGVEAIVKTWAKTHEGPDLRVGDKAWAWIVSETRALKRRGGSADWDGLEEAVRRAAEVGEPFEIGEWVKPGRRSEFKGVKVPVEQREELPHVEGNGAAAGDGRGAAGGDVDADRDRKFGVDAPW